MCTSDPQVLVAWYPDAVAAHEFAAPLHALPDCTDETGDTTNAAIVDANKHYGRARLRRRFEA
jgi:hypothetical protein